MNISLKVLTNCDPYILKRGTAELELEDNAPEGYIYKLLSWEISI